MIMSECVLTTYKCIFKVNMVFLYFFKIRRNTNPVFSMSFNTILGL